MTLPIARTLVMTALAVSAAGCKTTQKPAYIEDLLSSRVVLVQHHEIFASVTLKEGVEQHYVASLLLDYLEGKPGAPTFRYWPPAWDLGTRHRDFAASCLAWMTGIPLHIYTWQSDAEKDQAIDEFLTRLRSERGRCRWPCTVFSFGRVGEQAEGKGRLR